MTKPYVYKRVIAYIIDTLAVSLIAGVLSLVLVNNTKYEEDIKNFSEIMEKFQKEEINQEEYLKEVEEINYSMSLDSRKVTVITFSVALVYFGVLCYFSHGITLGKYLMKIKITSNNGKDLHMWNYLLRTLVVNLVLINFLDVLLVSILSKDVFITYYSKISSFNSLLLVVSFILIMYRNDGRGLEDFMANTKVINFKDENNNEVDEAKVIEEKEVK